MNILKNHVYFNIDKLGELVKNSLPFYNKDIGYLRSWAKANKNGIEVVIALNGQLQGFLLFDYQYKLERCGFKDDNVNEYYLKRRGMSIDEDLKNKILKDVIHWTH